MDLKEIGLSQQVWDKLHSEGRQKEAPPQIFCDGENVGGFTDLIEVDPEDLR